MNQASYLFYWGLGQTKKKKKTLDLTLFQFILPKRPLQTTINLNNYVQMIL